MILRAIAIAFLSLVCISAEAHVGSPNVFFEGEAGPYPIRVMIRPPRVVPGLAEITVRAKTNGVASVSVLPARWNTGRKGAPPPDIAKPVLGETNLYAAQLWLMDPGAYSVFVNIDGAAGAGTAIVPVNSLALSRLQMPRWMGGVFLGFGCVLFLGFTALIAAAVREGSLPIGAQIDIDRRKRGRLAAAFAIVLACGAIAGGNWWWSFVDNKFQRHRLYKPVKISASMEDGILALHESEKGWRGPDMTPLVPDHGKMMHLFLVSADGGRAFAHLHPTRESSWRVTPPPLPAGDYHMYGDVTHESGLTETWIGDVKLPAIAATGAADPDDAAFVGEAKGDVVTLSNGATITWQLGQRSQANQETTLKYIVRTRDGRIAELQPYLGMYAHAVIWKDDASVFTHLHPLGTISMISQLLFARRENNEPLANQPLDVICGAPPKEVSFPYAFPAAGKYHIWVQIKMDGQIYTAPFAIDVT